MKSTIATDTMQLLHFFSTHATITDIHEVCTELSCLINDPAFYYTGGGSRGCHRGLKTASATIPGQDVAIGIKKH